MILSLVLGAVLSQAADVSAIFVNANTAYDAGDFGRAAFLYETVIKETDGDVTGYVYYNLGNTYLRLGRLGDAIASYLKSQSMLPRNADVAANLAFARSTAKDAIEVEAASEIWSTLFFWHFALSRAELLWVLVVFNACCFFLFAITLFRRDAAALRWAARVCGVVALVLGVSTAMRYIAPRRVAVVRAAEVDVRSGTADDTLVLFKLHAGSEGRWLDSRAGWLRIAIDADTEGVRQGWLPKEAAVTLVL